MRKPDGRFNVYVRTSMRIKVDTLVIGVRGRPYSIAPSSISTLYLVGNETNLN